MLGAANDMIMEMKNIPKKSFTHLMLLEKHTRLLQSKRTRILQDEPSHYVIDLIPMAHCFFKKNPVFVGTSMYRLYGV